MATATGKARCVTCGKEKSSFKCGGCSQEFCFNHLADHKQELTKQFDEIEVSRDLFRQTLTEQMTDSAKHPLIQQIDKWERDSIEKIRQTAEESRQLILENTREYAANLEDKLNKLTDMLRQSRHENDFNEIDLRQFQAELTGLTKELAEPSNISTRQDPTPLITKISIDVSLAPTNALNVSHNARWFPKGITVAGGNGHGSGINQLTDPFGVHVDDDDQTVYVADFLNHRIIGWKYGATSGQVVAGGNGRGDRLDQLTYPVDIIVDKQKKCFIICDLGNRRVVRWPLQNATKGQTIISDIDCHGLAIDNNGYLYVADRKKHEVRRWKEGDNSGTVVAGGNGEGNRFDQLNTPTYIFVDQNRSVFVTDQQNHRVMKWMKGAREGTVVAGEQDQGNSHGKLSIPNGIVVDQLGTLYVAETGNDRVIRWTRAVGQGSIVVGGNGDGIDADKLNGPVGLSFDRQGNLYIADSRNNRVQRFNIDPSLK